MADPAWWCIRRSIGPSASVIAPITALSSPPWVDSANQLVEMRWLVTGWTTASASSIARVLSSGSRVCQVVLRSSPGSGRDQADSEAALPEVDGDRRGGRRRRTRATDAMPCPWWALIRLSTNNVARDCHGCSSRRTISSPTRAELRQWTRRRSSPRGTRGR